MKLEIPQFNIFEGRVIHGFSSKSDGNMDFRFGEYHSVLQARRDFLNKLGIDLQDTVWMGAVHGTDIALVSNADKGKGAFLGNGDMPIVDVLLTTKSTNPEAKSPVLALGPADCVPMIITDKNAEYLGMIHAGRKGTELGVATKTITALANQGIYPDQLLVGMGPSICAACYEMPYLETATPGEWWEYVSIDPDAAKVDMAVDKSGELKISPEGRFLFKITPFDPNQMIGIDVTSFNRDQLINTGVPKENIEIMDFCTVEQGRKGKIFSHHLTNENNQLYPEGRFAAVAQLAR